MNCQSLGFVLLFFAKKLPWIYSSESLASGYCAMKCTLFQCFGFMRQKLSYQSLLLHSFQLFSHINSLFMRFILQEYQLLGRCICHQAFNAMHLTFVLKCDCRCSLVLVIFTCLLRNILLQDCPERSQDFRQALCEKYNNIEFEGQYHEWLPFYGGTYQ